LFLLDGANANGWLLCRKKEGKKLRKKGKKQLTLIKSQQRKRKTTIYLCKRSRLSRVPGCATIEPIALP